MVDGVCERAARRPRSWGRAGWLGVAVASAIGVGVDVAAAEPPAATAASAATASAAAPADAAAAPAVPAASPTTPDRPAERWIQRFRPRARHRLEFGVYGGAFFPNRAHELYQPDLPWRAYGRAAPAFGVRAAYLPIPYVGAELEAGVMPVAIEGIMADLDGGRGTLYAVRGHVIGQLPLASVVPFVLIGGGGLGSRSDLLGRDIDLASHFGGGVKIFVHRYVGIRLDVRGTVTSRYSTTGSRVVHPEVLLGVVIPLGLRAADRDGDGSYDPGQRARPVDACPDQPGAVRLRGCPDRDVDTVADPEDRCPDTPGLGERRGCPALTDGDRDGVFDPGQVDIPPPGGDRCPTEAGLADYVGCPPPDSDVDGVADPSDKCVDRAETINGYQDEDGCPDEVPVDVAKFVGTLRGINFAFLSDTITADSRPALDHAVTVMRDNPTIRIEIQGHTDAEGDHDDNVRLSQRRAEAVQAYMIAAGIAADRLRPRGYGGDQPVADNETEAGRARNRRIELRLIDANDKVITAAP
jgi:OOP family OmpA-OmpF porin